MLDAFRRIGGLEVPVLDILPSPDVDRYRNKVHDTARTLASDFLEKMRGIGYSPAQTKISDDEITFVTGKDVVEGILKYKNEL